MRESQFDVFASREGLLIMHVQGREIPAKHNVLGVFGSMHQAHHAAEVLERGGIDAGDIRLLGPSADVAQRRQRFAGPPAKGQIRDLVKGLLAGSLIGLAIGAVIGVVAAWLLNSRYIALGALLGAVAGLTAGSLVGMVARVPASAASEESRKDVPGRVGLLIGSEDNELVHKARRLLDKQGPQELREFDEDEYPKVKREIIL